MLVFDANYFPPLPLHLLPSTSVFVSVCPCVFVCVGEEERGRRKGDGGGGVRDVCVLVSVLSRATGTEERVLQLDPPTSLASNVHFSTPLTPRRLTPTPAYFV